MKSRVHRKMLAVTLLMLLLLLCFSASAFAAYENTYRNTGNQRVDIVGVASTQVGNTNSAHRYRADNNSWCASFVVWCARQAGIDSSIIKNTGWATADDLGVAWKTRSAYTPKSGDLIIFDWVSNGLCKKTPASSYGDHVGIVESVKNGYVYTIEGNSSGKVARRSYTLGCADIKGYGVPAYKNSATTITSKTATNWSVSFKLKSGAYTNAYSSASTSNKVGRVYTNDVITFKTVYDSGWAQLSCPWDGGGSKIVYCKITELKFKATKYINAYSGQSTSNKVGRVYPGDVCNVQAIYPNTGYLKCQCPWDTGGMKTIYVRYSEIY